MLRISQHISGLRKEALLKLLELEVNHKFMLSDTDFSLHIDEVEEEYLTDLIDATPFLARTTHKESLFELLETRQDNLSVTFAMTDGYVIIGTREYAGQEFDKEKNVFVYRYEDIGHAVKAAVDWLYNPVPIPTTTQLDIQNGIANGAWPASVSVDG